MALVKESALSDSVIYRMMNNNKELLLKINECIKKGQVLDSSYIEEQLYTLSKVRISPLVDDVLKAYREGHIVLVYNKNIKVPQAIPFVVAKSAGVNRAFIFVSNYGSIDTKHDGKTLNIALKDLYALLESAYIAYSYYNYPVLLKRNLGLMKFSVNVYVQMWMRIMNREYSLSLDQDLFNRTSFIIGKFFLSKVWESENTDLIDAYAMATITNPNRMDLDIVKDSYNSANINSVDELVNFIKTLSPRLSTFNLRYFVECYINLYRASAIFSMDCLPYFLFAMSSTLTGSFIVNQPVLGDIIKNTKGANTFYQELSKVI